MFMMVVVLMIMTLLWAVQEKEIPTCVLIDFMAGHRLEVNY